MDEPVVIGWSFDGDVVFSGVVGDVGIYEEGSVNVVLMSEWETILNSTFSWTISISYSDCFSFVNYSVSLTVTLTPVDIFFMNLTSLYLSDCDGCQSWTAEILPLSSTPSETDVEVVMYVSVPSVVRCYSFNISTSTPSFDTLSEFVANSSFIYGNASYYWEAFSYNQTIEAAFLGGIQDGGEG